MILYSFIFCLIFRIYKSDDSPTRIIFVSQKISDPSFCFMKGTCDGSVEKPMDSLAEAINEGIKSIDKVYLDILNAEYVCRENEFLSYMLLQSKEKSTFSLDLKNGAGLVVRGNAQIATGRRCKLVITETFFSLEVGIASLEFVNIDIIFDNLFLKSYMNPYFIKLKFDCFISTVKFNNVSLALQSSFDDGSGTKLLALILIENKASNIYFCDCTFVAGSWNVFEKLVQSLADYTANAAKQIYIVFNRSLFLGTNANHNSLGVETSSAVIEALDCTFDADFRYWNFVLQNSDVTLRRVLVKFSTELTFINDSSRFLFSLRDSALKIIDSTLKGKINYNNLPDSSLSSFAKFTENNIISIFNTSLSELVLGYVFDFQNKNTVLIETLSSSDVFGTVLNFGSKNIIICKSSSFQSTKRDSAIQLNEENCMEISRSEFLKNQKEANFEGGAIRINNKNYNIFISTTSFKENKALSSNLKGFGGAIYIGGYNSNVKIENSSFSNNIAYTGTSVYFLQYNQNISIASTTFSYNAANFDGGSLYFFNYNKNIYVSSCKFLSNKAASYGSSFFFNTFNQNATLTSSSFLFNTANVGGGVVYLYMNNKLIYFTNNLFYFNYGFQGAIVFTFGLSENLIFQNCTFDQTYSPLGTILFSVISSNVTFNGSFFTFMNYSNSVSVFRSQVFRMGNGFKLGIYFCNFKDFVPMFPNTPILELIGFSSVLSISDSSLLNIVDFFINDNTQDTSITISMSSFVFDGSFNHEELFLFKTNNSNITFRNSKIVMASLTQNELKLFSFSQKILRFNASSLEFDSPEKIGIFFFVLNPQSTELNLKNFIIRKNFGSLVQVLSVNKNEFKMNILSCIFTLNSTVRAFLDLVNTAVVYVRQATFMLTNNNRVSFFLLRGPRTVGSLIISRTKFCTAASKFEYSFFESESMFALIHAEQGLDSLILNKSSVSIGNKNLKSLLYVVNFKKIVITATYLIRNHLNRISSLMIFSLTENCSIKIDNSKIEDNRAVYAGLLMFVLLNVRPLNITRLMDYAYFSNNTVSKNEATISGGLFYFNASMYSDSDFPNKVFGILTHSLKIYNTSLKERFIINFFFFDSTHEQIMRLNQIVPEIISSIQLKLLQTANPSIPVVVGTLLTNFKVFSSNTDLGGDSARSTVYSPVEFINKRDTIPKFYFCIEAFDDFGQPVVPTNELDINASVKTNKIIPYLKLTINSLTSYVNLTFREGLFCAYSIFIDGDYSSMMGNEYLVELSANNLKEYLPNINLLSNRPTYEIALRLHECKDGELFKEETCIPCPRNTYLEERVVGSLLKCTTCMDDDKFNCYGGNIRSPKKNFWRLSKSSHNFLRCPTTTCIGDPDFARNLTEGDCLDCFLPGSEQSLLFYSFNENLTAIGFCLNGYQGNLCSECQEGLGSTGKYKCDRCNSGSPYIKHALITLFKLLFFYFTCWISIKNNTRSVNYERESETFIKNIVSIHLLNILFMYGSVINVLKLMPFDLSDLLDEMFTDVSNLSPTESFEIFTFDCISRKLGFPFANIFSSLLMNIFFFMGSTLVIVLMFVLQVKKLTTEVKSLLKANISGIFLIFFMNNIILFLGPKFKILFCINIGDASSESWFLLSNLSLQCSSSEHNFFRYVLAVPLIILFGFIIPCMIFVNLYKARKHPQLLMEKNFLLKFGYFVSPYRTKAIFFEIIFLFHKLSMLLFKEVFILFILQNKETIAAGTLLCYLLFYYNIFSTLVPYDRRKYSVLQKAESLSLKVNISNSLSAVIWTLIKGDNEEAKNFKLIVFGYVIISNTIFIIRWFYHFLESFKRMIKNLINLLILVKNSVKNFVIKQVFSKKTFNKKHLNYQSTNVENHSLSQSTTFSVKDTARLNIFQNFCLEFRKKINALFLGKAYFTRSDRRQNKSSKKLIKENFQLKMLVKLLLSQIENREDEEAIFSDLDEGQFNNLSKYIKDTKIGIKSFQVPRNGHEGSPNHFSKNHLQNHHDPYKNPLTSEVLPSSSRNLEKSKIDIKQEYVSKKLFGLQFCDYFLQLKYKITGPFLLSKPSMLKVFEKTQAFYEVQVLDNRDWIASVSNRKEKRNYFFIALKKLSPWIETSFSQNLSIEIKINEYLIQINEEVKLLHFFKVLSLKWSEIKFINADNQNLLISKNIGKALREKIFKYKFAKSEKIHGHLRFSCPILEVTNAELILEVIRNGDFNIYGKFIANKLPSLVEFIVEFLNR